MWTGGQVCAGGFSVHVWVAASHSCCCCIINAMIIWAPLNSLYVFLSSHFNTVNISSDRSYSSCCSNYKAKRTQAFNGRTGHTQVEQRITARHVPAQSRGLYGLIRWAVHKMNSWIIPLLVQYQLTAGESNQTEALHGGIIISLLLFTFIVCCVFSSAETTSKQFWGRSHANTCSG